MVTLIKIIEEMGKCHFIKKISIISSGNRLYNPKQLVDMLGNLKNKNHLKKILINAQLNNNALDMLVNILDEGNLTKLRISRSYLSLNWGKLFDHLNNCNLIELDLSDNYMTNYDKLSNVIAENISIITLTLSKCHLEGDNFDQIMVGLGENKSIENLNLFQNKISNSLPLTNMLKENNTLKKIDLSWNNFNEYNVKLIKSALKYHSAVEECYIHKKYNIIINNAIHRRMTKKCKRAKAYDYS